MIRDFHLADWFTLANAFCGTGAIFAAMRAFAARLRSASHRVHYLAIDDPGTRQRLTDNLAAAERATRHLIDLGHRHIALIAGPEHASNARGRVAAVSAVIEQGATGGIK